MWQERAWRSLCCWVDRWAQRTSVAERGALYVPLTITAESGGKLSGAPIPSRVEPQPMNAANDPAGRRTIALLTAAALAAAASFGGMVHGNMLNEYDARQFFYLTNPDGPAGDYRAQAPTCRPGGPQPQLCRDLGATLAEE